MIYEDMTCTKWCL